MVDIHHRQGQNLARALGRLVGAAQFGVESLAVAEVGQGVGGGVAAHLGQVVAQLVHFLGRFLQLLLQDLVLFLDLARGVAEAGDEVAEGGGVRLLGQLAGGVLQGRAIGLAGLLGGEDGARHGIQFAAQLIPGVADLFVQLDLGQEGRGQRLAGGFGEGLVGRNQAVDLMGQGRIAVGGVVQPQFVIERGRPDLVADHHIQGAAGEPVGVGSAQDSFEFR